MTTSATTTDLVLEGGGVKGIALAGTISALAESGYTFARIAGTSAGAMAGAVLAAMVQCGESLDRLEDIALSLDYAKVPDRPFPAKAMGPAAPIGDALDLIVRTGLYRGDYLRGWIKGVLAEFGVHTFGDLRLDDADDDGSLHHRYRFVAIASDVSRKRLVQLPWDYDVYGLDRDEQLVCDAVRASASMPYIFEPVELTGPHGTSTLVDGGLLANYPISVFDRTDARPPRWPTIGVRLDAFRLGRDEKTLKPVRHPVRLGVALVETAIEGTQAEHVLDPCNIARSIYIDTDLVDAFDFDITAQQQQQLLGNGRKAATDFLSRWDYDSWLRNCR